MPKRKATKAELEYGIGIEEIDEDGIEPEDDDNDEQIVSLACDEENDIDDEELIAEYHKQSVPGNDVWEDDK